MTGPEYKVGDRVALRGTIREIAHGTAIVAVDKAAETVAASLTENLIAVELSGLGRLVPLIVDLTPPDAQEATS